MSGNFAILNLKDQAVKDLQYVFAKLGGATVKQDKGTHYQDKYHPGEYKVFHGGGPGQPNNAWTQENKNAIVNAFHSPHTSYFAARINVPRHQYVEISSIAGAEKELIDRMIKELEASTVCAVLARPQIFLKELSSSLVEGIGTPRQLWDNGKKASAVVLTAMQGDISIEYFQERSAWV